VAVKVVHPHLAGDHEFLERFRREVAAASKVSGMYAAAVVASGVTDDPPWLATAYVPGPSLAALVDGYGPLPDEAAWRLGAGLTEALRNVHGAGLVHRDLKPANVLIADDGPRVIDFGISRALEGTPLTSAGMVVGTAGYMSPEQLEGGQASPASDVFSLGCVLAYAAVGRPPFGAGSEPAILYRVVTAEPDLDRVSPALREVIEACLRKDPARRPGLAELAAMIETAGPPANESLGSFWPEPVASLIAAARADAAPEAGGPRTPASPRTPTEAATAAPAGGSDPGVAVAAGPLTDRSPGAAGTARLAWRDRWLQWPPAAAVPPAVRAAIGLMCLGFAATVADLILSAMALGDYNDQVQRAGTSQAEHAARSMADAMALGVAAAAVGLAGWVWLAVACRRGAGWTRFAAAALVVIETACTLLIGLTTNGDAGAMATTITVWATGVATTVLLWSRPARAFFGKWRRR
jgi:Protein kinase domain